MPAGKSYDNDFAPGVPMNQRRQAGKRVSYDQTKVTVRSKAGSGHLGTLKPLPKP